MTAQDRSVLPEGDLQVRKKEKAELRKRILKERNELSSEQRKIWDGQIFERLVKYDAENPCPVYLCYVNNKSEVNTKNFILWCLEMGKTVFVPRVFADDSAVSGDESGSLKKPAGSVKEGAKPAEMEFYRIVAWEDLKAGYRGILEPEALPERSFSRWLAETGRDRRIVSADGFSGRTAETGKKTPTVRMLLPGAVFDKSGNRIGYGGGFYDRWLAKREKQQWNYDGKLEKIGLAYRMQIVETLPAECFDKKVDYMITEDGRVQ